MALHFDFRLAGNRFICRLKGTPNCLQSLSTRPAIPAFRAEKMPSRPMWKGQIRLSLVSIPVELFTATKTTEKIAFRQIHEPTGKPVHYQKVVAGVGPVETDDIRKGFEYEKGNYVLMTDDEIDAVKLETRKTFDLQQFVGADEIEPIYFDKPYYVVPQ